ncbi:hypothetical protein BC938DRAFT_476022 [Jimgerdemannia flammicorona]|uniref:Uncharacterized protein n=1 Tax=Jimgerdemannia flammicorona TaxID=994334 RepID=A0A433QQZ3_9FUNG|nr:hypothetical protein BC938DRAFT_476022 [Jimgerdemannia flammicorona]
MVIDNSKLLQVEKKVRYPANQSPHVSGHGSISINHPKPSQPQLPRTLALLFVHDLLFTKRGIQSSDGSLKQAVLRHQTRLKAELVKAKIKLNARTDSDLVSQKVKDAVHIPRYVRVNEHQTTVKKVLDKFQKEGYVLEETKENLTGLRITTYPISSYSRLTLTSTTTRFTSPATSSFSFMLPRARLSTSPARACDRRMRRSRQQDVAPVGAYAQYWQNLGVRSG